MRPLPDGSDGSPLNKTGENGEEEKKRRGESDKGINGEGSVVMVLSLSFYPLSLPSYPFSHLSASPFPVSPNLFFLLTAFSSLPSPLESALGVAYKEKRPQVRGGILKMKQVLVYTTDY